MIAIMSEGRICRRQLSLVENATHYITFIPLGMSPRQQVVESSFMEHSYRNVLFRGRQYFYRASIPNGIPKEIRHLEQFICS
jgi:phage portal protein BeeE